MHGLQKKSLHAWAEIDLLVHMSYAPQPIGSKVEAPVANEISKNLDAIFIEVSDSPSVDPSPAAVVAKPRDPPEEHWVDTYEDSPAEEPLFNGTLIEESPVCSAKDQPTGISREFEALSLLNVGEPVHRAEAAFVDVEHGNDKPKDTHAPHMR